MHETRNCTLGSAAVNNCFGFRVAGKFLKFKTKADSYAYFESLWVRAYSGGAPTWNDALKYSGKDRTKAWYNNVHSCLNK